MHYYYYRGREVKGCWPNTYRIDYDTGNTISRQVEYSAFLKQAIKKKFYEINYK